LRCADTAQLAGGAEIGAALRRKLRIELARPADQLLAPREVAGIAPIAAEREADSRDLARHFTIRRKGGGQGGLAQRDGAVDMSCRMLEEAERKARRIGARAAVLAI